MLNSLGRSEGCSVGTLEGFGEAPLLDCVPGTWFGSSDGRGDSVSSWLTWTSTPEDSSSAGW